ncbi:MAG TPA: CPBP family intramembrane metalloprotease [Planctomycetes bacterium]|nr:CPBP family intramembrane metalloprotease [Planctomycetaceae bacterium]HIN95263.1 CPBP family intramembrane metalloprotease [Planctomycetota bacterium]
MSRTMKWANIKLICVRELRDQLRDRRTLFTILILPLVLYPLLGMTYLQVAQFLKDSPTRIWIIGTENLPQEDSIALLNPAGERFNETLFSKSKVPLLKIVVNKQLPAAVTAQTLPAHAEQVIGAEQYEVVVYFPDNFGKQLRNFRDQITAYRTEKISAAQLAQTVVPSPQIYINSANDKSQLGFRRTDSILRQWRQLVVKESFRESRIPEQANNPFQLEKHDVAKPATKKAVVWSKILPFFALVWALAGAFYPAVDLCAGEKERGTLETLLCSPADRREIVWGKMITVMVFSILTALLNLLSLGITGALVFTQISQMSEAAIPIGIPPLSTIGWLLLALIPIAALFSALALAVAAFARSTKEGQYYLMPLLLICMPLMTLSMLPSVELDLGTSLIPITGMMLLLRTLSEQHYWTALQFVIPVLGVTATCCWLASRWAIAQFNNESVLFCESERWDLKLWLRHLIKTRGDTPTPGMAVFCGLLLLLLHFFANFIFPNSVDSWANIAFSMVTLQLAFMLLPTLLLAFFFTRQPTKTFLVRSTSAWSCLLAILLAVCLHPLAMQLQNLIQWIYPINSGTAEALQPISKLIADTPWYYVILVIAVVPAICEELVFRGFLLSGFRRLGKAWSAIALSSLFFAIIHGILQQSLNAFAIGLVIGYIAVKTGSLLPCILYHLTHNTITLFYSRLDSAGNTDNRFVDWIFYQDAQGQYHYELLFLAITCCIAAAALFYYIRLPGQLSATESLHKTNQQPADHA